MDTITKELEEFSDKTDALEGIDLPALEELVFSIERLDKSCEKLEDKNLHDLMAALLGYIGELTAFEAYDIEVYKEAAETLQIMIHSFFWEESYKVDLPELYQKLHYSPGSGDTKQDAEVMEDIKPDPEVKDEADSQDAPPEPSDAGEDVKPEKKKVELDEDEILILNDFVLEALDSLESIELSLIELEQEPSDKDIINSIFRPFHTIKGISGFLGLMKINQLAHVTENLLDDARNDEFVINDELTDIILESVDVLKALIANVEESVASGSGNLEGDFDVEPLKERITKAQERAKSGEVRRLGDILVETGALGEQDIEKALGFQKESPDAKLGEILIEKQISDSKTVIGAIREQKKTKKTVEQQVKVDTGKLDNLVDFTGELVISQTMLRQNSVIKSITDQKLFQNLNQLSQIVTTIQKIAMSMRMVPIRSTFQKMVRLVRDLARNSGKKVDLKMSGDETEIDRNVVEQLYEPMVHMIRNSVDHGLEQPEDRVAAGKTETGTVSLAAFHQGGNIIIEITDNGKGLNKEGILAKAKKSNLITDESVLSESEIFDLIFQPGFSTAATITDVSGRGVGMDVVKRGIEKLRGRLNVRSEEGQGTTIAISLPLTLAIIDGMIVRVGTERYILPAIAVVESFRPKREDCFTVKNEGEMVKVRGGLLPLMRLNKMFDLDNKKVNPWEALVVVVENKNEHRGILLDELLGKEEVVIKNLGESLKGIMGLAGGAILGDGRVGLILDMDGLFRLFDTHD